MARLTVSELDLEPKDVAVAVRNWFCWRDVFMHRGPVMSNPILEDDWRFKMFVREYGVARTIKKGQVDQVRKRLIRDDFPLSAMLSDRTGYELERCELRLRGLASREGGSLTSLVSKVAAFLNPRHFSAWDQYAPKGARRILCRRARFSRYTEYLTAINGLLREHKTSLDGMIRKDKVASAIEDRAAFRRRVLDVYLMRLGDRNY